MRSRKLVNKVLCTGILTLIAPRCYAQDPVKECLSGIASHQGLFKTVTSAAGSHSYKSAKEWFCSDDFLAESQNSSTAASVETPWGAGAYNANDSSQVAQRQHFCQNTASDFDTEEQSYLTLKEGDPVIAQDLQVCLAAAAGRTPYLISAVNPYPDGTFDILVSVRGYPGNNPLVVSQGILGGASPADVSELHAGATIPFQGSGTAPITATYKFDAGSPMARVKVVTSIGSITIPAVRCPIGKIGTWETDEDSQQSVQVPMPQFSDSRNVPQASCHPHCGAGDFIPYDFAVSSDIVLSSANAKLVGGGAVFDSNVLTQPHPFQLHVVVNTRSTATTLVVTANQTRNTTQTVRQKVDSGDITAGHAFTVKLDDGTNGSVVIKDSAGTAISLTAAELQADSSLPSWLKLASTQQHSGTSLLTNLVSSGPGTCVIP